MIPNVKLGTVIAESYTVTRIRDGNISGMGAYISKAIVFDLDSKYENNSLLSFYILKGPVPPEGQWPRIGLEGLSDDWSVKRNWKPQSIQVPCGALEYTARTANGAKLAVIHMMAASKTALVLAITTWAGFPGLNRFFVGVNPGMEMRNEDLLKVGLELSKGIIP